MSNEKVTNMCLVNQIFILNKIIKIAYLVELPLLADYFSLGFDNSFRSPTVSRGKLSVFRRLAICLDSCFYIC